ncbi:hypothetical protein M728_001869 [Ensifer sp. WSM1721]|uniref:hypothetical protein n=1 Tax=Ensifer sp. WSM1721 TaxID=1041159 RepID=UPI001FD97178|nr:hypothetical protein [Ensifer sp. WSM1721]
MSLKDYVRYQMTDGPAVTVREFDTDAEQEKEIQERIEQIGGSPLTDWNLPGMGRTTGVSTRKSMG